MKLTIPLLRKALEADDGALLVEEPMIVIKEPKQLAFAAEDDEVHGWQWYAYTDPDRPLAIDHDMGEQLKEKFGFIRLAIDRKDGSELWGDADGSYLGKWKGHFASKTEGKRSSASRIGMTYKKSRSRSCGNL